MKDVWKFIIFVASGIILGIAAMYFIAVLPAKYRADAIIAKQAGTIATLRAELVKADGDIGALKSTIASGLIERGKLAENLERAETTVGRLSANNFRLTSTVSGLEAELGRVRESADASAKLLEELGGLTLDDIQILRDLQSQQRESSP